MMVVALTAAGGSCAFARGGNLTLPAGDALQQTPPPDVTRQQVEAASPQDVMRARELVRYGILDSSVLPPAPAARR